MKLLITQSLSVPMYLVGLGPSIFLGRLLKKNLCLCSSLNVTDHVSRTCKATGKIIVLYNLMSIILGRKLKDNISGS